MVALRRPPLRKGRPATRRHILTRMGVTPRQTAASPASNILLIPEAAAGSVPAAAELRRFEAHMHSEAGEGRSRSWAEAHPPSYRYRYSHPARAVEVKG